MRTDTYKCDRCASTFSTDRGLTPTWLGVVEVKMTGFGTVSFDFCRLCAKDLRESLDAFVKAEKAKRDPTDRIRKEDEAAKQKANNS